MHEGDPVTEDLRASNPSLASALERRWYEGSAATPLHQAALGSAAALFGLGVRARNAAFDRGWLSAKTVPGLRVISVGNLNVGGTGKTPVVIYLAQRLQQAGRRVVVLSRGYGRTRASPVLLTGDGALPSAAEVGDEPRLIAQRCPAVPVWVGADRAQLAARARAELHAEVALLDDGFQHRRLARDLDVLVVDERVGFGNGALLPAGPLREPVASLGRAGLIWRVAADGAAALLPRFDVPVVRARHAPSAVVTPTGALLPLEALAARPVIAFAAIARPDRFLAALASTRANLLERHLFPDHHALPSGTLKELAARAAAKGAWLMTTEKDLARLPEGSGAYSLRLGVTLLEGEEHLAALL